MVGYQAGLTIALSDPLKACRCRQSLVEAPKVVVVAAAAAAVAQEVVDEVQEKGLRLSRHHLLASMVS